MVIDIHTHVVPEDFPPSPAGAAGAWPCMRRLDDASWVMHVGDKPFRNLDARAWDVPERLAAMAREGSDMHVLSPMPELLSYWMNTTDAVLLARHVNRTIANMVARAPSSFVGLGSVPMQDEAAAVAELDVIKWELGLAGIEVGASINDVPLGAAVFRPILARAQELGLAVFVHSVRPSHATALEAGGMLTATVGYPLDVATAVVSFLLEDIRGKLPELRIAFAHGGGALMTVLPRLRAAWERSPKMRELLRASPTDTVRGFYFDSVVYEPALLMALLDMAGSDRICIGSDEPFEIRQARPADAVRGLSLPASIEAAMLHGNAKRFLALH